jgi:tetratricopeptide (TPR) repeat protein
VLSLSVEKESVILNNKGAVLVHLQRFQEALDYFAISYRLRKNKFGEENLMTYNSLENVASMKFKLGLDLSDCIRDYERVLKFKERKFGIGSREALMTKANLAFAFFEGKRYEQSLECFHYCLEKWKSFTESGR